MKPNYLGWEFYYTDWSSIPDSSMLTRTRIPKCLYKTYWTFCNDNDLDTKLPLEFERLLRDYGMRTEYADSITAKKMPLNPCPRDIG